MDMIEYSEFTCKVVDLSAWITVSYKGVFKGGGFKPPPPPRNCQIFF